MRSARGTRKRQPARQQRLRVVSDQMRAGSRPSQQLRAGGPRTPQAR